MKNETLSVILINPFLNLITKIDVENSLEGLQVAIGGHNIEITYLDDGDIMYVDEEGLYRENQEYFLYKNNAGKVHPFSGKAIVLGDKGDGENYSTESNVIDYGNKITFATIEEIRFILSNQGAA